MWHLTYTWHLKDIGRCHTQKLQCRWPTEHLGDVSQPHQLDHSSPKQNRLQNFRISFQLPILSFKVFAHQFSPPFFHVFLLMKIKIPYSWRNRVDCVVEVNISHWKMSTSTRHLRSRPTTPNCPLKYPIAVAGGSGHPTAAAWLCRTQVRTEERLKHSFKPRKSEGFFSWTSRSSSTLKAPRAQSLSFSSPSEGDTSLRGLQESQNAALSPHCPNKDNHLGWVLSPPVTQSTLTSGGVDNVKCKFVWAVLYLLNTNKKVCSDRLTLLPGSALPADTLCFSTRTFTPKSETGILSAGKRKDTGFG